MRLPSSFPSINCDLGEGVASEAAIIPWIDAASVACGGHYGDRDSLKETLGLIRNYKKKAGAHPSYPDRQNFGRKSLGIHSQDLIISIREQINLFLAVAEEIKIQLDHIKFHGALYNDAAENFDLAQTLVQFLHYEYPQVTLFVPPYSELEKIATKLNHPYRLEVFGDRAYTTDYKLVRRTVENSMFAQKEQVISHLECILMDGKIRAYSGEFLPIQADTICYHGDNPGIMEFLPIIRNRFWK